MSQRQKWSLIGIVALCSAVLASELQPARCHSGPRQQSATNLRLIGIALRSYSERYHSLPPGAINDGSGRPLHGWPTLILPFADHSELYDAMNFARPWDDPEATGTPPTSNRTVTDSPVSWYKNPGVWDLPDAARATAFGYAANAWILDGTRSMRLDQITDGAAQTILAGEVAGDYRPWGEPGHWRDPGLGINKTPRGFGSPVEGGANFLFADGSVRFLRDDMDRATFRALATPGGNEPQVDLDDRN